MYRVKPGKNDTTLIFLNPDKSTNVNELDFGDNKSELLNLGDLPVSRYEFIEILTFVSESFVQPLLESVTRNDPESSFIYVSRRKVNLILNNRR